MTTDENLRFSLSRLTGEVAKDAPPIVAVLTRQLVGTLGNLADVERGRRYWELGGLLAELGRIYRHEAKILDPSIVD